MTRSLLTLTGITLLGVAVAWPCLASSDSVAYTYDQDGRLWTVTYANGTTITYTYDTAGNRQQVVTACSAGGC